MTPLNGSAQPALVVAGTFTVDPVVEPLTLLLRESGLGLEVELGAYGQVFQELLDPTSAFARNRSGVNALLIRFEDWLAVADERSRALDNVDQLIDAIASGTAAAPLVLFVCPASPAALADPEVRAALAAMEARLTAGVRDIGRVRLLTAAEVASTGEIHDPEADRLGHVPYQPVFFAALGLALARAAFALKQPPHKVLVLDCDNTLWRGVVGEDGPDGIEITPQYRALQQFVVAKKNAGMIICLASKNVDSDVIEVFNTRNDMVLKLEDVVAMRVNWLPKSENIRALAAELNLGLDSFVFIDDNPVECAEVAGACPGVLALNLPLDGDGDFAGFLAGVWPLDQLKVTDEDRRRTELYRENLARDRYEKSSGSLAEFLAGLQLSIEVAEPEDQHVPRVAQLTQRTNQFNFSTRRCSQEDIARLGLAGQRCRVVNVSDRFGDYGLVGAMIFEARDRALHIDTLLLSCRVLGRGVEHTMLRTLGGIAQREGLAQVVARFVPTKKNLPARRFLDSLTLATKQQDADGATSYAFDAEALASLSYEAGGAAEPVQDESSSKAGPVEIESARGENKSARWNRLARALRAPHQVLAALDGALPRERALAAAPVAPRGKTEEALARIWREVLHLREIGTADDYFEIGGTSLLAVAIFGRLERELGIRLPLAVLTQCPTISQLAARIDGRGQTDSLVSLTTGAAKPLGTPLFLVHDADGETLLYRNLARRFAGTRAVYGLQPAARPDAPIVCTSISEMAVHYVAEVRAVQPRGPYLLGGLCAGGVIAFEMARLFEQAGETAHLVALFDAADVAAVPRPDIEKEERKQRLRSAFSLGRPLQLPGIVARKAYGYLRYKVTSEVSTAWQRFAIRTLRYCLSEKLPVPQWVKRLTIRQVYVNAESEYRPNHKVREDIVLFRATQGEGDDMPYARIFFDPQLGWGPRSAAKVRVHDVPGGHGTMLQEPHVAVTAARLKQHLDDIEARSTAAAVDLCVPPRPVAAALTG